MTLLLKHAFTGGAGALSLNGLAPNFLDASFAGTTFGFAAGTATLNGSGYVNGDAYRVVKINIPGGQQTTHDWVLLVKCRYAQGTPSSSDNMDLGILTNSGDAHQYFLRNAWSSGTNYYTQQYRRLPAATFGANNIVGENTQDASGNAITSGTNNTAGDVWFGAKKVGTSFWAMFDIGNGMKANASATDSTFTDDGVLWFSISNKWDVAEVQVWTATDKKFIESGNFDPTADPDLDACVRRHYKFDVEMAKATPYVGGWWSPQGVGSNPWVSASAAATRKYSPGFTWSSGSGNANWHPAHGIFSARDMTFSIWVHLTTDWASWSGGTYILNVGDPGSTSDCIKLKRTSATQFGVEFQQHVGADIANTSLAYSFPFGDIPVSGDDVCFHVHIRVDGRIEAGVNGMLAIGTHGSFTGTKVHASQWFEAGTNLAGLQVGYLASQGTRNANCEFSDLAVYNGFHRIGKAIPTAPANTLTVTPGTPPAGINFSCKLLGVLGRSKTNYPNWDTVCQGKLGLVRDSAKKLLATPIEYSSGGNGSTATTPGTASGSTAFYDWGPVDRDMVQDTNAVNFGSGNFGYVLVGLGGVPRRMQDAAGTLTAYYSGSNLSSNTTQSQSFVANVPNFNATNTGTIAGHNVVLSTGAASTCDTWAMHCADLVLHIKDWCTANSFPFANVLFNFWNEGDTGSFWKTTNCFTDQKAELEKLYNAAVTKIRAQTGLSGFKMSFIPSVQYPSANINAFMAAVHAAGNDAGIDALDTHDYTGGVWNFMNFCIRNSDTDRTTNSLPSTLPFVISEDGFNNIVGPGLGASNFGGSDPPMHSMAIGGTILTQKLIACAKSVATTGKSVGASQYVLTGAMVDTGAGDIYRMGGLSLPSAAGPTALLNCYDLLCRMALDTPGTSGRAHGTSVWSGVPGVGFLTTLLSDGTVRVLFSALTAETITVDLPAGYANYNVKKYTVDDQTSSYYDTSGSSTNLAAPSTTTLDGSGNMSLSVRANSVTMLEIADTTAPVFASASLAVNGFDITVNLTEVASQPVLPAGSSVSGFTVKVNGVTRSLANASRASNTSFVLTVSGSPINLSQVVTLDYTPGNVTDSAVTPNAMGAFTGQSVTNGSTVPAGRRGYAGQVGTRISRSMDTGI